MFKKRNLFLMFFVLIAKIGVGQLCEGTTVVLIDSINYNVPVNWVLAFDEEFNGTALDTSVWQIIQYQQGEPDGSGSYNTLDNVTVSPDEFLGDRTSATGVCQVIAKKEDVTRLPVYWNTSIPPVTYILLHQNLILKKNLAGANMKYVVRYQKAKVYGVRFGCMANTTEKDTK